MYGMEKVTVKMSDIVKKMGNHVPESFLRHYILLATVLTITAFYYCTTVQAILFFSLWYMRQGNFFLKILLRQYKEDNFRYFLTYLFSGHGFVVQVSTKNTRTLSFSLLNN